MAAMTETDSPGVVLDTSSRRALMASRRAAESSEKRSVKAAYMKAR
jgi:hypothetical protein